MSVIIFYVIMGEPKKKNLYHQLEWLLLPLLLCNCCCCYITARSYSQNRRVWESKPFFTTVELFSWKKLRRYKIISKVEPALYFPQWSMNYWQACLQTTPMASTLHQLMFCHVAGVKTKASALMIL